MRGRDGNGVGSQMAARICVAARVYARATRARAWRGSRNARAMTMYGATGGTAG